MYLNNIFRFTNIDKLLKEKNININLKPILVIIILIVIVVTIIFLIPKKKIEYFLTLNGDSDLVLYAGTEYIESGFNAYDSKGNNYNEEVIINGDINTSITGNYIISYQFKDITESRYITIIPETHKKTILGLYGKSLMIIPLNSNFIDPGYYAIDSDYTNKEIEEKVQVTGLVDTSTKGTYKIIYTLVNDKGISYIKERTVIVTDSEFTLDYNPKEITNNEISITGLITNDYYEYLLLPNGEKETNRNITYKVTENNTYKFILYSKDGTSHEEEIKITNIDKKKPSGSCFGYYSNNKSIVTIYANDDNEIKQYEINGNTYINNKIELNGVYQSLNVIIYDKANNTEEITCTMTPLEDNENNIFNQPIYPKGNENIVQNISKDTIKIWIEKKNYYYVSHIWVLDAYNQMKTAVPNNFGTLEKPSKMLESVIKKHDFQNKSIIAVNASGFVLKNVYSSIFAETIPAWNKTGLSPLVIVESKVIRDFTNKKIPSDSNLTYGLKKDGYLEYYKFKKGNNLQDNINIAKKIIDDGVQNTFAFSPVLVYNGKRIATSTDNNLRQGFCQIDKNNFIFITNNYTRELGFSFKNMADYMISLGCQTGFNLDGGGSTTLLINNNNKITKLYGNARNVADILYFHE